VNPEADQISAAKERQVADLYIKGLRAPEIAQQFGYARSWADTYIARARQRGLIPPPARASDHLDRVIELYGQGLTLTQIASDIGRCYDTTAKLVQRARKEGLLPPAEPANPSQALKNRLDTVRLRLGYVQDVFAQMDETTKEWLIAEAAAAGCDTIAEYLAELAIEAYYAEQEEKDDAK